ncbi:MAG TPA: NAD-binding protein [Stellaceae bacterium]|jgi:voltage-gated potassium channel Kch
MNGSGLPAVLIVGGDALALNTAREICELQGHHVTVLWSEDAEFASQVEAIGARFVAGLPGRLGSLERAGVAEAVTILALSADDQLNLRAALRARDVNPQIRIVLRQFNRTLARKIEQNLPDCSVVSLAWLSASTYAAVALDPSSFRGLEFPERGGPLTAFASRTAEEAGITGETITDAEESLDLRIVAIGERIRFDRDERIARGVRLVLHGTLEELAASTPRRPAMADGDAIVPRMPRLPWRARLRRIDRFMAMFALAALMLFAVGTWHFRYAFSTHWLTAAYFVLATMTTTGYGDLTPDRNSDLDILIAMMLMLAGVVLTGIFIGFAASMLTQARYVRMQGLRRIRRRGHIVVCGAGSIGSGVIDLLLGSGRSLVVVERSPDPALIERARDQGFDLLTGDASRDDTLDLCNLGAAHSLVALTNVDTLNLEIALGGRVRNPDMPIVLRIADASFAASIARHFQFETTFSAEALAAPAFAGLSRLPGARGRIVIAGQEFGIGEMPLPENYASVVPEGAFPLAVMREERLVAVHRFDEVYPGETVLVLFPRTVIAERGDTFAAIADRIHNVAAIESMEPGNN